MSGLYTRCDCVFGFDARCDCVIGFDTRCVCVCVLKVSVYPCVNALLSDVCVIKLFLSVLSLYRLYYYQLLSLHMILPYKNRANSITSCMRSKGVWR